MIAAPRASRAMRLVGALLTVGVTASACEEAGPAEADGLGADVGGDAGDVAEPEGALPIPLPPLPSITCAGRTCENEKGTSLTLAPRTTTVGDGTGIEVESLDENGTMVLRPGAGRTLTERPRAIVSTDPPYVAAVRSMRVLDDGRIVLETQEPESLLDVFSDIQIDHEAPLQFSEEGITGPLADAVRIVDRSAADSATEDKPELEITDKKVSLSMGGWKIEISDLDLQSAGVLQFYLMDGTHLLEYNYTHGTAQSRHITFRLRIVQSLVISAKLKLERMIASGNAIPEEDQKIELTWDLLEVPYRIPVVGPFFWISGGVGLRFTQSLEAEAAVSLEHEVRIGGAVEILIERNAAGDFLPVKFKYVPTRSGDIDLSGGVKLTAEAGLELFVWAAPYEFKSTKAELSFGGKFKAELELLASVGTSFVGAAFKWVMKFILEAKFKFAEKFVAEFFPGELKTSWSLAKTEYFLNCGQCATYFGGCRLLCGDNTCKAKCDCVPKCKDKVCGSDGCGGSCGNCTTGNKRTCNETSTTNQYGAQPGTCFCNPTVFAAGSCKSNCGSFHDSKCASGERCSAPDGICVPKCQPGECGSQWGDYDCGACSGDDQCINGLCVDCGTCQGCGGTDACGRACDCPNGQACENGQCVEDCPQGCAPDQYCSAGVCVGCTEDCGTNAYCSQGECVACDPGCSSAEYCYRGQCIGCAQDCGTQAYCLYGSCVACAETCAPGSRCVEGECQMCECGPQQCGSDGCGGSCGQCSQSGQACNEGVCEACQPQCDDRECGSDRCGSECGICGDGFRCDEGTGQCEVCTPDCTDKLCGPDGCGGSCGACDTAAGEACNAGRCLGVPLEETCVSRAAGERCCDSRDDDCRSSSGRCFCDTFCETANDCCPDYDAECSTP